MPARTYPIDPNIKWSIYDVASATVTQTGRPWARADMQPISGDPGGIVYLEELPDQQVPYDPNNQRLREIPPEILFDDDTDPPATGTIQRKFQASQLSQAEKDRRAKDARMVSIQAKAKAAAVKLDIGVSPLADSEVLDLLKYFALRDDLEK